MKVVVVVDRVVLDAMTDLAQEDERGLETIRDLDTARIVFGRLCRRIGAVALVRRMRWSPHANELLKIFLAAGLDYHCPRVVEQARQELLRESETFTAKNLEVASKWMQLFTQDDGFAYASAREFTAEHEGERHHWH